jgi:hypothetical protein
MSQGRIVTANVIGWTDSVGQIVAWSVSQWTDRQGTPCTPPNYANLHHTPLQLEYLARTPPKQPAFLYILMVSCILCISAPPLHYTPPPASVQNTFLITPLHLYCIYHLPRSSLHITLLDLHSISPSSIFIPYYIPPSSIKVPSLHLHSIITSLHLHSIIMSTMSLHLHSISHCSTFSPYNSQDLQSKAHLSMKWRSTVCVIPSSCGVLDVSGLLEADPRLRCTGT